MDQRQDRHLPHRQVLAAHQDVKLTARLNGVQRKDMYGVKDYTTTIKIGAKQISKVNTKTHMMYVYRDGKKVKTMRISAGMATTREYTTHLGRPPDHGARQPGPDDHRRPQEGRPRYYDVMINHAVRISTPVNTSTPRTTSGRQGRQNVSHGCINSRPDQAKWFHDTMERGDVSRHHRHNRELEWNNGWGFWQLSFKENIGKGSPSRRHR
ncbi:L,D-transpeptidase [Nonomuraea dietziae]|uniref:L,D-transpeptidase n=1 Tax=Nonomuraea dietziae TaxID=65515 RepID=UPI0031DF35D4